MRKTAFIMAGVVLSLVFYLNPASAQRHGGGYYGGGHSGGYYGHGGHSGGYYHGYHPHYYSGWYGGWGHGYYPRGYWWGPWAYAYPGLWWSYPSVGPYAYYYPYAYLTTATTSWTKEAATTS